MLRLGLGLKSKGMGWTDGGQMLLHILLTAVNKYLLNLKIITFFLGFIVLHGC